MAFGDVVQSNSGTSTTATTAPTLGSATTAGNLIVLTFAADDYNGTPNSGWTQSSEMEQQTFHGGYIWWLTATASMTIPSYTIGSATRSAWTLVEYAGPFDASPYDTSQGVFQQTSADNITSDAMTPTAGSRLMVGGLNAQHATSDQVAWDNLTGSFTEAVGSLFNGGNPRLTISQLRRIVTADGSTSYTVGGRANGGSQSRSALIIAFKASAGGGSTYNHTTAETTTAADTPSGLLVTTKAVAEAAAAAETITKTLAYTGAIAESASAADTTAGLLAFTGAIAEVASAAETIVPIVVPAGGTLYEDTVLETLAATDVTTGRVGFDPISLGGLTVWVDASQLGLADGTAVSPWPDLSGNGNDGLIVGSPAPVVRTGALNGLPVVRFKPGEGRVRGDTDLASSLPGYNFSVFYVGRMVGPTVGRLFSALYPATNFLTGFHTSGVDIAFDGTFIGTVAGYPGGLPTPWKQYGHTGLHDGVNYTSTFYVNGSLIGTAAGPGGLQQGWNLSGYEATGTSETCDGEVAELLIYNHKLSDAERIQVEAYLGGKWFGAAIFETLAANDTVTADVIAGEVAPEVPLGGPGPAGEGVRRRFEIFLLEEEDEEDEKPRRKRRLRLKKAELEDKVEAAVEYIEAGSPQPMSQQAMVSQVSTLMGLDALLEIDRRRVERTIYRYLQTLMEEEEEEGMAMMLLAA